MTEQQACAVCGQGGYWTGYSPRHGEDRCINHLSDESTTGHESLIAQDESRKP